MTQAQASGQWCSRDRVGPWKPPSHVPVPELIRGQPLPPLWDPNMRWMDGRCAQDRHQTWTHRSFRLRRVTTTTTTYYRASIPTHGLWRGAPKFIAHLPIYRNEPDPMGKLWELGAARGPRPRALSGSSPSPLLGEPGRRDVWKPGSLEGPGTHFWGAARAKTSNVAPAWEQSARVPDGVETGLGWRPQRWTF